MEQLKKEVAELEKKCQDYGADKTKLETEVRVPGENTGASLGVTSNLKTCIFYWFCRRDIN